MDDLKKAIEHSRNLVQGSKSEHSDNDRASYVNHREF